MVFNSGGEWVLSSELSNFQLKVKCKITLIEIDIWLSYSDVFTIEQWAMGDMSLDDRIWEAMHATPRACLWETLIIVTYT